ncbi:endonuclease domain-containing protein, partial [Methylobacterium haplocladii]|uniref:endonuclease domain-containing protein n=1 Tax=Methylobacterium haplocladii TaxID=1176176 RepID=UPI0024B57EFA
MRDSAVTDRPGPLNPVDRGLRTFARGQRSAMTRAEALFWQQVRAGRYHGIKFRRQVPIAPYIVDFLCASARVVVELDGPPHEAETRRRRDAKRDAWLRQQGFQVLRFSNDLVLGNLDAVLDVVGATIEARAPIPPPSAGEGGPRVSEGRERGAPSQAPSLPSPDPLRGPPSPLCGGGW